MKENKTYKDLDFRVIELDEEYYRCTFEHCDFTEILFQKINFEECKFVACNFSLCKSNGTSWNKVSFEQCKLTGANFSHANKFTFNAKFAECLMQFASFQGLNLQGFQFAKCQLAEADFTTCNLKKAQFIDCNLDRSIISHCNLEETDFSTAFNFIINPNDNRMKKAKFSLQNLPGLVAVFDVKIV